MQKMNLQNQQRALTDNGFYIAIYITSTYQADAAAEKTGLAAS
jgi:hypothetical protein